MAEKAGPRNKGGFYLRRGFNCLRFNGQRGWGSWTASGYMEQPMRHVTSQITFGSVSENGRIVLSSQNLTKNRRINVFVW